jgi:hypothetical protein
MFKMNELLDSTNDDNKSPPKDSVLFEESSSPMRQTDEMDDFNK